MGCVGHVGNTNSKFLSYRKLLEKINHNLTILVCVLLCQTESTYLYTYIYIHKWPLQPFSQDY